MSLRSNYEYIRDWVNAKFLKKEDADKQFSDTTDEITNVKEDIAELNSDLESFSESYLKINDYVEDEQIIAASLTDLDRKIKDLPNTDAVMGEEEEKVIAHVLTSLNDRIKTIEDADYGSQLQNAGKVDSVTLNNIPASLDNKVAKLTLTTEPAGAGNVVTNVAINGTTVTVTKGNVDLSSKEDPANKVTSISSSSTDVQYPSAKAVYTQLQTKEDTSNKVTSMSSSSTDTQYPSAKAVYTVIGDVESVLDQIITPKPQISVADTFEIEGTVGTTTQDTFRVYGDYLTANVGMTKGGTDAALFTLNPTSVAKANALAGQNITIKYAPTAAGTHTATITFTSTNADSKVMTITGTAVNAE